MLKTTDPIEKQNLHSDEYKEACESIRHYSSLQSNILTVFIATFAGLAAFTFQVNTADLPSNILLIFPKISGIITTLMFWLLAERATAYWFHFKKRAAEIEQILGYSLHSTQPKSSISFLKTIHALRFIYIAVAVFWLISLALP